MLKLFLFHHAGGGPVAFVGWRPALGSAVEVVPVTLPGRGRRGWREPHADMAALAEALADRLGPELDGPHVFYGHSMGALVAFRLAQARIRRGLRGPERLLVGASAAPHRTSALARAHGLDDEGLAGWLLRLSDAPEVLSLHLEDPRLRAGVTALLREDLRLCATAAGPGRPDVPLPCPIDVFAGLDDQLVPVDDAALWSAYSTAGSTLHTLPGGHFFPRESPDLFFREVEAVLVSV